MKMLIVDDSLVIRRKIERLPLAQTMTRVVSAENGVVALLRARQLQPDLVTMDLTMPQMDGVECVRQILQEFPAARILVVSALTDKATALAAIKLGARGFLGKPFTESQLESALLKLMAKK